MRYSLVIAALAFGNVAMGQVAAEPLPTVAFRYEKNASAQSCPAREDLERGVEARLGRTAFRIDSERSLVVRVSGASPGFKAEIVVYDPSGAVVGTRSLATAEADCTELLSALELAIAIAIDPLHATAMSAPPPAETERSPMAPPPVSEEIGLAQPLPPPPPPPPLPELSSSRAWIGAGLLLSGSEEPSTTIGFTFSYKHRATIAWALELRADLPSRVDVGPGQVQTALSSAAGFVCLPRGALDACGVLGLGMLRSAGLDYRESFSALTPYAAAGGRIAYRIDLHPSFGLEMVADLLARLNHTSLLVDQEVAWDSSPFEFSLGLRGAWGID